MTDFPYPLMDDVQVLASLGEWDAGVYQDFFAFQRGEISRTQLEAKYKARATILCLDMTGFTETAIKWGEAEGLVRIFNVQRVCVPIFQEYGARLMRAFADDLTVIFDDPLSALRSAFEVHKRVGIFNQSKLATGHPAECCIGIGHGDIYAIGPNLAMGDEMNRASKLGEDTARAQEVLITKNMFLAVKDHPEYVFKTQLNDDLVFPFYAVSEKP